MSGAKIIPAVTARLAKLLEQRLVAVGLELASVTTSSPLLGLPPRGQSLNLYLYMVRKEQFRQVPGGVQLAVGGPLNNVSTPVFLKLYYLLSASASDPLEAQLLFGHGMQVMADNVSLPQVPSGVGIAPDRMKVLMLDLDMHELNAIWTSAESPRPMSVAYEVSPILLEPNPESEVEPAPG